MGEMVGLEAVGAAVPGIPITSTDQADYLTNKLVLECIKM
jgi:hypothetical protein